MPVQPVQYGSHSPFTPEERETIEAIYEGVGASGHPEADELRQTIQEHVDCLEALGGVVTRYPSPQDEQRLGRRVRGLDTLVDTLSRADPANFAFFVPTRALLGRSLDMAESNFYRLLRHICREVLTGEDKGRLLEAATERLRVCLYTRLVEEVLSAIATDDQRKRPVRERAVVALAQIWEQRLTYRVSDFFPILQATWDARQRITITGGTLAGTQEILALFAEGCDPKFVDCFARPDPGPDEVEAFREFVFAASAEELNRVAKQMAAEGISSVKLHDAMHAPDRDSVSVFYEFFRSRYYLAMARRVAQTPGPRHTAEGYVMIHYLGRPA
jgi:hypothetical protein